MGWSGGFRGWRGIARLGSVVVALAAAALLCCAAPRPSWQVYLWLEDAFAAVPGRIDLTGFPKPVRSALPTLPSTWEVTASVLADVTGDGEAEWVLLVWRAWRDWPIQRWSSLPSPIAGFHDAAGDSCHLILLDPQSRREIWAGSALPVPMTALEVGDVDGDGIQEVVTLEGSYEGSRDGPASRVDVWRWNGFGFTLERRSPPRSLRQLCLIDIRHDGLLDIAVR